MVGDDQKYRRENKELLGGSGRTKYKSARVPAISNRTYTGEKNMAAGNPTTRSGRTMSNAGKTGRD